MLPEGDAFVAHASNETVTTTLLTGTAPIATSDRTILVLGDYRGDICMIDLDRPLE